ncbi:DUF4878 domain-containing protein [Suttonella indologenes]|uniref:Lumazine-binding domain n=1 Tax=Suttonella indologenes TaxID=13276 RepID=A0A380N275_9GAMM|nr:DUF4878 domain-containing protein [Suttonella indologenes]SUO97877.1 Lumazine-binding domain [Suttonella indologenes]
MKKLLVLSALSLMLLTACGKEAPAEAAETFFTELLQGDVKKALSIVYLPAEVNNPFGLDLLEQVFNAMQEELKKQGGVKKITAEKVTYNSDKTQASVVLKIETNNGQVKSSESINVVKDNGVWKVKMQ